jgi:hypothetical protein
MRIPLPSYHRIQYVQSFDELVGTPFHGEINALCWPRILQGDFAEIAGKLDTGEGIVTLDDDMLLSLELSPAGIAARQTLLEDQELLRRHGLDPVLDRIGGHLRTPPPGPFSTEVYSFHADSATAEADTYLCTYHGESSEGLPNEQALRKAEDPTLRAALWQWHGGTDEAGFEDFLTEHGYDLHYAPLPGAVPYSFGVGNLWRIALVYPGCPVPPCIHRAPETRPGDVPRLLLLS